MKKYNVFKILLITFVVTIILSYLIPQSIIGYSGIEKGQISPITLIDSVSNGLTSFSVFIATFVFILSIGILYSILKKSEKYDAVINNTAVKFKNNKKVFLIISILTFGLLTSVIGDVIPMLVFVPAFIDIARKLGYDSKKSILSTVGAIILGNAGALYTNYTNQILSTTVSSNIIPKIIVLVISLVALILFAVLGKKPEDVKLEKVEVQKGLPISIAFDVILVLLILGMVPWNQYFGFEGFDNFHNTLVDFKVFDVSLFNAIIGTTLSAFGAWTLYTLTVLLLVVSVILAIIYKIKVDSLLESVSNGIRKALPYAFILVIANVILVSVYNSGFYITIMSSIGNMVDSVLSSSTISALSALVYPDYSYANQFTLTTLTMVLSNSAIYSVLSIIFQMIYSLVLLISPTSVLILMALRYEQVSYKNWIKYIYKFFLGLLIVFYAIIIIVANKYVKVISYVVLAVLAVILVLFIFLCKSKKQPIKKEELRKTEEKKVETKKEKTTKKTTTKKPVAKKSTTKKK